MITRQTVGEKLEAYLNSEISLAEIVDWAETTLIDDELEEGYDKLIFDMLARIGLADMEQFRLYWDEIAEMFEKLGYRVNVSLQPA